MYPVSFSLTAAVQSVYGVYCVMRVMRTLQVLALRIVHHNPYHHRILQRLHVILIQGPVSHQRVGFKPYRDCRYIVACLITSQALQYHLPFCLLLFFSYRIIPFPIRSVSLFNPPTMSAASVLLNVLSFKTILRISSFIALIQLKLNPFAGIVGVPLLGMSYLFFFLIIVSTTPTSQIFSVNILFI